MATWIHDSEIYASLAEGEPGPARDWATTRLALYAAERFAVWPDDARCHDVVLAAAPPRAVEALRTAIDSTRPCPEDLANAAAAIGAYGLLPADASPLILALRGALRRDGDAADLWLAFALSQLGAADADALGAAARSDADAVDWVLPILVLRVAEARGALDEAAHDIATDLLRTAARDPMRLYSILAAMGAPLDTLTGRYPDLEAAAAAGARLAGAETPALRLKPGSARRRQQEAVRQLLDGVAGPMAALLRASYAQELRSEWDFWGVAVAAWLRGRRATTADPVAAVLDFGEGRDLKTLAAARAAIRAEDETRLLPLFDEVPDTATSLLAVQALRVGGSATLAERVMDAHGGRLDTDVRTAAAACVAATRAPDRIPTLLRSHDARKRILGLLCAEWVPSTETLEALLEIPVPAEDQLRLQYARCLAAMGDPATVDLLAALRSGDEAGLLHEPMHLAEALLHVKIEASDSVRASGGNRP